MSQTIQANSLVTLHYRISLPSGQPLISTFNATPATLQLGAGEMLPAMEKMLVGLSPGTRHVFELEPENAFGPYRDELVELMGKKAYAVLVEYCQAHEEALSKARGAARQALAPHPADPQ